MYISATRVQHALSVAQLGAEACRQRQGVAAAVGNAQLRVVKVTQRSWHSRKPASRLRDKAGARIYHL